MTGLLDVLKESALATGFLDAFETSASREALPRARCATGACCSASTVSAPTPG